MFGSSTSAMPPPKRFPLFKGAIEMHSTKIDGLPCRLLNIGEAAARTSPEIQATHSDLPWSEMIATRNRLIHGYDDIDLDIVWRVVTDDLPPLLMRLQEILGDRPA